MADFDERPPPLDAEEILLTLSRHGADFVVIGGIAVQSYLERRTTQDVDVLALWTPENMALLAPALRELGAQLRGVDADLLGIDPGDPAHLYQGGNFLMRTKHGDLDVLSVDEARGAPDNYGELRDRALRVHFAGRELLVAHPEDLIRMKTAASRFRDRPEVKRRQDLEDVAVLNRLLGAGPGAGERDKG